MSLSMDGITSYLDTTTTNAADSALGTRVSGALGGLSADSSEEELVDACKTFESYMLEQVLKNVKESTEAMNDEEESSTSQYTDMYMDSTLQELSETLVDQYGDTLTNQLVDQMKRNYGIE